MRIEELERELASRLKCPHAAPVDQISSGRKPSDCDDHSAVITQLEAQVETLRQSLLNEVRDTIGEGRVRLEVAA